MRWLLVSSRDHPSQGGIGTYVAHFSAAAAAAGWHVELVTRPGPHHPPGIRVHEVTTPDMADSFSRRLARLRRMERVRPYRYALWSLAVARTLLEIGGDFDAVEFVDCQAEGYVALTSRAVRARFMDRGTPMLVHAHTPMFVEEQINGADPNRFGRDIYHEWERQAIRAADGVIATSAGLIRRLPAIRASAVIAFPISAEHWPVPAARSGDDELILLIGSVQPRKGVEAWVRSLNVVLQQRPRARAVLIGEDTPSAPGGGSMIEHVQSLIEHRFHDRFEWIGQLPHKRVLALIAQAALVAVPSVFESFSFVAAEAIACGAPVVVSDQVGLIEHVAGLPTFAAGDADALAAAQLQVLADPGAARDGVLACRERLFQACSPPRHLDQRRAFVESISKIGGAIAACDSAEIDALEAVEAFLTSVEQLERAPHPVSNARS